MTRGRIWVAEDGHIRSRTNPASGAEVAFCSDRCLRDRLLWVGPDDLVASVQRRLDSAEYTIRVQSKELAKLKSARDFDRHGRWTAIQAAFQGLLEAVPELNQGRIPPSLPGAAVAKRVQTLEQAIGRAQPRDIPADTSR